MSVKLYRGDMDRVEFYLDEDDQWRWRFRAAGNGRVLADSGQGYAKSKQAWESCRRVVGRLPAMSGDPIDSSDIAGFVVGSEAARRWFSQP